MPLSGLLGLGVVTYDTALHDADDFQCRLLGGGALVLIGAWNNDCVGVDGLGDEIYDRILVPGPPPVIAKNVWDAIWINFLRFDNRYDFLQMTAYVLRPRRCPRNSSA